MKSLVANKRTKNPVFQILLLDNDASDDVEVQEAEKVNFFQVKEHLKTAAQFLSQARIRRKWFTLRPRHNLTITNQEETMGSFSDSI